MTADPASKPSRRPEARLAGGAFVGATRSAGTHLSALYTIAKLHEGHSTLVFAFGSNSAGMVTKISSRQLKHLMCWPAFLALRCLLGGIIPACLAFAVGRSFRVSDSTVLYPALPCCSVLCSFPTARIAGKNVPPIHSDLQPYKPRPPCCPSTLATLLDRRRLAPDLPPQRRSRESARMSAKARSSR